MAAAGRPAAVPTRRVAAGKSSDAALVVYSTSKKEDAGIATLKGEYAEEGTNHGRKTYRKLNSIKGHEALKVFLYYWDERDGADFSGWWFGASVGGSQVWSRAVTKAARPPKGGWAIPWDGEINPDLVVMSVVEKQAMDQREAKARQAVRLKEEDTKVIVDWEQRVQNASEKIAGVVIDADEILEQSAEALNDEDADDETREETVKAAGTALTKQATAIAETLRFLANEAVAAQKAPPALKAEMAGLTNRVKKTQQAVKDELMKCRNFKRDQNQRAEEAAKKAEDEVKNQELEIQQQMQLEEMMPALIEKVDHAEDEVEKVAIASAPLLVESAEELRPVMMQAIKETEQRVRAANTAISEAKRLLASKQTAAQRFVGAAKAQAEEDFGAIEQKLKDAQGKVDPYKTCRQDYEQRVQGKKILDELNAKISGAEIEVEKAAMMTAPGDSVEGIKETETALGTAQSALAQSSRLVESKLRGLEKQKGPVYEEVKQLQERAKAAQEKLDEVRKTVKETQVRIAADNLLRDASEKVSYAEDELQRMTDAELPLLKGDSAGKDMQDAIEECEKAAGVVHTALGDAQTFVAKKLVEVARFSEGHARAVREDLDSLQKRLSEGRNRLQQFKASVNERKRSHMLAEVETKIASAEEEVRQMQEATSALGLGALGKAGDAMSESFRETLEKANAAERAAQESIVVARKSLLQKTAELKNLGIAGMGSGSDLGKFQTRVNNMQQEIAKLRNSTKDAEERVRAKQTLAEVSTRLQATEQEVDKVAAVAAPADDDLPSIEAVERVDKLSASAQTKISATLKLVEIKLKSAAGALKEELQGMKARLAAAEKKLGVVLAATKEQKERVVASGYVSEAASKVAQAEASLQKASESELPFLKGIEIDDKEAGATISLCEVAGAEAQKSITSARSYVVEKIAEAKKLSEKVSQTSVKDLQELQKKLDAAASRIAEFKKDTAERKRKTQMQASASKINGVEEAVQTLATTMAKFADDVLHTISPDEARSITEEIASAEQSAKKAVSSTRKFLAERLQEIKSYTDAQRAPMMADITKLQARLTQCQVELAKLSNQCTEREQKFVAQKLIEDANQTLKKFTADSELASKVAGTVLNGEIADIAMASYVQSAVGVLHSHMKKTNASVEDLFGKFAVKGKATKEQFVAYLDTFAGLPGKDDTTLNLTNEQLVAAFSFFSRGASEISASTFKEACRETMICSASAPVTTELNGDQEVAQVEVDETIIVLEKKDSPQGGTCAKCTLARDGSITGWVSLEDAEGNRNFKPSQSGAFSVDSIFAYVAELNSKGKTAADAIQQKALDVSSVKQGPLAEVGAKLSQLHLQFSQEQTKVEQLKSKLGSLKTELAKRKREEQQTVIEIKAKEYATRTVKEATVAVEEAEGKASAVIASAKGDGERTIAEMESIKVKADEAIKSLEDAKAVIARIQLAYEGFNATCKSSLLEARVEITKLKSRAENQQRKCSTATESIRSACAKLVKDSIDKARAALRTSARSSGKASYDDLFGKIAGGREVITEAEFAKFVEGLPHHGLSKDKVSMLYHEFGSNGLKKIGFAKIVQEYNRCVTPILLTDGYDIEESTGLRKLEKGEAFEVLEGPKEDPETKVARVRGRALRDGVVGWVSVAGNQGTSFLTTSEKPYVSSIAAASLLAEFNASSAVVRTIESGELLELLEGPREDQPTPTVKLHCKASKDDAEGWITVRSAAGVNASPREDFYICVSTIAMTDVLDLKTCKVLKKIVAGEVLQVVDPEQSEQKGIGRMKFRSTKDGKEGFVTIKGNQGTVYLELSKSHYVIENAVTLALEGSEVRELAVGEAVEALEMPKEEKPATKMGMHVRGCSDGKCGWIVWKGKAPVKPVNPRL